MFKLCLSTNPKSSHSYMCLCNGLLSYSYKCYAAKCGHFCPPIYCLVVFSTTTSVMLNTGSTVTVISRVNNIINSWLYQELIIYTLLTLGYIHCSDSTNCIFYCNIWYVHCIASYYLNIATDIQYFIGYKHHGSIFLYCKQ